MRADALERKHRILFEARRLFAERGKDISLDTIAEASNVGIATLYRNFASRNELIVAVTLDVLNDIEAALPEQRPQSGEPPRRAWERLVHRLVELNLGAMTDALGDASGWSVPAEVTTAQNSVLAKFDDTLHYFARAGSVRADLTALEVVVAIGILTRPQPHLIQRAVPGVVPHLVEAFLGWSRPQ